MLKKMDHAGYMRKTRKMSPAELRFVIEDAKKAILAMPENPNCGYYQDEIHYCAMEIERRR